MRFSIIADDITGANDSGVQLARCGLETSVLFDSDRAALKLHEAVVLDTDSRSINKEEAYSRVKDASELLKIEGFDIIYKKIDSTMRGNIGIEIDAIYDVFNPDFVIIAPAYPKIGRTIVEGYLLLQGTLLHETEIAKDPKSPVTESHIPQLISGQTSRQVGHVGLETLSLGPEHIKNKLEEFRTTTVPYIVFDSETEDDLKKIASYIYQTGFSVIWLGSAGLANYLPEVYQLESEKKELCIPKNQDPVLLVAGSVSTITRNQLERVMSLPNVKGIKIDSVLVVSGDKYRQQEIDRAIHEAEQAVRNSQHVVLYSSGTSKDIKAAQDVGKKLGLNKTEVSNVIVGALGDISSYLLKKNYYKGIILTGGDTAKQVCSKLDVKGFELIDEIEPGIPIGKLIGRYDLYAITKAGAFGTEETFVKCIRKLQGESIQ
jgi:uncharacterized protein YgbK (DUF1537 family)